MCWNKNGLEDYHTEKNILGCICQYLTEIDARYTFIQHEVYIPSGTDDKVLDRGDYILSRKRMILFIETVKELYLWDLSNLIDLSTGVFSLIT